MRFVDRCAGFALLLAVLVFAAGACGGPGASSSRADADAAVDDDASSDDDDNNDNNDDDNDDDNDNDDNDNDDNDNNDDNNDASPPAPTSAAGDVYRFDPSFSLLAGAEVSVVERPDLPPVSSDDNGHFLVENLYVGDDITLLATDDAFYPTQSATVLLPAEGLSDLTVQIPPRVVVWLIALVLGTPLEAADCQIAATVSPAGGIPNQPGIAGAAVTIDPPLPADNGPFYFEFINLPNLPPIDIPVRGLTATSDDGGVAFMNVPPGDYVLTASKAGSEFTSARLRCRPGVLVNASPPYGLQLIDASPQPAPY